jgi:hypothetical protein
MAARKNSTIVRAGGVLLFLASLIYLYVVFTGYASTTNAWLISASFLGPFVIAFAVVSVIVLFFMSLGTMAGMATPQMLDKPLWIFYIMSGVTTLMVGGVGMFFMTVVGFVLASIGSMAAGM